MIQAIGGRIDPQSTPIEWGTTTGTERLYRLDRIPSLAGSLATLPAPASLPEGPDAEQQRLAAVLARFQDLGIGIHIQDGNPIRFRPTKSQVQLPPPECFPSMDVWMDSSTLLNFTMI